MSRQSTIIPRTILCAGAALTIAFAAAGCNSNSPPPPPTGSPTAIGSAASLDWALSAVDKAIDANGRLDKHTAAARARLLGGSFTTSTRETNENMAGGSYIVTVYCAGNAQLTASIKIGAAQESNTVTCSEVPQPTVLKITTTGGPSEIQLTAVDGAAAAGYFIDSNT